MGDSPALDPLMEEFSANSPAETVPAQSPPVKGDEQAAEKYINSLVKLIQEDKLNVKKTDLDKFNLPSLQTHYFLDLGEYNVEVSHSKHAETGKDFYIMLFNNLKKLKKECPAEKVILAYIHLKEDQFDNLKEAAEIYLERKKKKEEEKRFKEAMEPIDKLLDNLNHSKKEDDVHNSQSDTDKNFYNSSIPVTPV